MKLIFKLLITLLISYNISFATSLRLIKDQNILTGEKFKDTEIGGLSGLVFDQKNKKIYSISDDRGHVNSPRLYEFDLDISDNNFKVTPSNVIFLKNKDGKNFKTGTVDFEGITIIDQNFLISSEGNLNRDPVVNPELIYFTRDGSYIKNINIPEKFLPAEDGINKSKLGARDNLIFEALSSTPDQKIIFVGTEEALIQDGKTSTYKEGSTVRVLKIKNDLPEKEFGYQLDPIPSITVAGLTVGETGLVDFAAIDENNFYSLERAFLPLAKKNVIKIFKNKISDETTDISKIESIKNQKITTINKTLISNLEEFTKSMDKSSQRLDNIEGICFGPMLKNGHQTLIVVSDNNFAKNQRTLFMAFEIIEN